VDRKLINVTVATTLRAVAIPTAAMVDIVVTLLLMALMVLMALTVTVEIISILPFVSGYKVAHNFPFVNSL